MVVNRQKHVECLVSERNVFNEIQLQDDNHKYSPISMIEGLLPERIYNMQDGIDLSRHDSTLVGTCELPSMS